MFRNSWFWLSGGSVTAEAVEVVGRDLNVIEVAGRAPLV